MEVYTLGIIFSPVGNVKGSFQSYFNRGSKKKIVYLNVFLHLNNIEKMLYAL